MNLIERLLGRSVAQELKDHGRNMRFWGQGIDSFPVEQSEDGVNIIDAAKLSSSLIPNSKLWTQAGIAWEFSCGEPIPKNIQILRQQLMDKAHKGAKLTHDEEKWLRVIQNGTDWG